jgi:hypothetical protein
MNAQFYKNSVFSRPDDGRDMVCHASAYDLCVRNKDKDKSGDHWIKMFAEVDQYNFGTIHREMGPIQVISMITFAYYRLGLTTLNLIISSLLISLVPNAVRSPTQFLQSWSKSRIPRGNWGRFIPSCSEYSQAHAMHSWSGHGTSFRL